MASNFKKTFQKRTKTKTGNVSVTKGWSKKGTPSKVEKTVSYKTKNGQKRKMVITTTKRIVKR